MADTGELVTVQDRDGVRTITLVRPAARNAMSTRMRTRLCDLLADADRDPAVAVVILTGGDEVFSAGVDFKELAADFDLYRDQFAVNPGRALRAMRTPTIAAVSGPCVSGALELALSCSFIVASETARFADTHARLGGVATWGLTALLPRAVGVRMAREMSLTGMFVDATTALRLGLINHVVPVSELTEFTRTLAASLVGGRVAAELLELYERGADLGLTGAFAAETAYTSRQPFDPAEFARLGALTARGTHTPSPADPADEVSRIATGGGLEPA